MATQELPVYLYFAGTTVRYRCPRAAVEHYEDVPPYTPAKPCKQCVPTVPPEDVRDFYLFGR